MLSTLPDISRFIDRHTSLRTPSDEHYYETEIDGLSFMRTETRIGPIHSLYEPSICVTVQGAKQVAAGETVLDYRTGEYLVVGLTVPTVGRVVRASLDEPYLGLKVSLSPSLLLETISKTNPPATYEGADAGLFVGRSDRHVVEALGRLLELLETPDAIPLLHPVRVRELYYWLLNGPDGTAFARLALPDGHVRQVARAVSVMKRAFPATVRVDDLASAAGMSPSSFYTHFKEVTGTTPIQYYKRLRLLEARRLMTAAETVTAQDVAYRVGYESPSQFSREYNRAFGAPPRRDRVLSTHDSEA